MDDVLAEMGLRSYSSRSSSVSELTEQIIADMRDLESKMGIVAAAQQRFGEENLLALLDDLCAAQDADFSAAHQFERQLAQKCARRVRRPATLQKEADEEEDAAPVSPQSNEEQQEDRAEADLERLLADYEKELRSISAAKSKCYQIKASAEVQQVLSERQHGGLQIDSLFDYYLQDLTQLCGATKKSLRPLFVKAAHRMQSLAEERSRLRAEAGAGAGAEAGAGAGAEADRSHPSSRAAIITLYAQLAQGLRGEEGRRLDDLLARTRALGQGNVFEAYKTGEQQLRGLRRKLAPAQAL